MEALRINARVTLPADELSWTAARSGGPGGQHVNKTSTKVDLRFDLDRSRALSDPAKERLRAIAPLDSEGRVFVQSDSSRSQSDNLEDARQKLAALVRRALTRPKKRRPTKPSRAAKRRRLEAKSRQSQKKAARGPVRYD